MTEGGGVGSLSGGGRAVCKGMLLAVKIIPDTETVGMNCGYIGVSARIVTCVDDPAMSHASASLHRSLALLLKSTPAPVNDEEAQESRNLQSRSNPSSQSTSLHRTLHDNLAEFQGSKTCKTDEGVPRDPQA